MTVRGSVAPLIELGAGFDYDLTAEENVYLNGALWDIQERKWKNIIMISWNFRNYMIL